MTLKQLFELKKKLILSKALKNKQRKKAERCHIGHDITKMVTDEVTLCK